MEGINGIIARRVWGYMGVFKGIEAIFYYFGKICQQLLRFSFLDRQVYHYFYQSLHFFYYYIGKCHYPCLVVYRDTYYHLCHLYCCYWYSDHNYYRDFQQEYHILHCYYLHQDYQGDSNIVIVVVIVLAVVVVQTAHNAQDKLDNFGTQEHLDFDYWNLLSYCLVAQVAHNKNNHSLAGYIAQAPAGNSYCYCNSFVEEQDFYVVGERQDSGRWFQLLAERLKLEGLELEVGYLGAFQQQSYSLFIIFYAVLAICQNSIIQLLFLFIQQVTSIINPKMDTKQPLPQLFTLSPDSFLICTGQTYKTTIRQKPRYTESLELLHMIINTLGQRSAASQGLKQVITNVTRFLGTDQRIYIKIVEGMAIGFVKVGQKTLFYRDFVGNVKELHPTCVLDIYVHESCQRSGYGKEIFEKFLKQENISPQQLAYDRPSPKLIAFLKKYYQLSEFVPQNNNYVIFNKFFTTEKEKNGAVNKYFFPGRKTMSKQKENSANLGKTNTITNINSLHSKSIAEYTKTQQSKKQKQKIIDSLDQIIQNQKNKPRTTPNIPPSFTPFLQLPNQPSLQSNKPINYHNFSSTRAPENGARYSLNMKLKDLSYRVPWAIETPQQQKGQDGRNNFRTTSGAYGDVYRK